MSQQFASGSTYPGFRDSAPLLTEDRLLRGVLTRRVVAWWLDLCIVAVLGVICWLLLVAFGILTLGLGFHLMAAIPLLPVLYNWGFLASDLQATPGQAMCGLMVVRDDDLGPPTAVQALVSILTFYLTVAIFAPLMVAALFTTRHRTLHDLAAGLTVVRRQAMNQIIGGWPA